MAILTALLREPEVKGWFFFFFVSLNMECKLHIHKLTYKVLLEYKSGKVYI